MNDREVLVERIVGEVLARLRRLSSASPTPAPATLSCVDQTLISLETLQRLSLRGPGQLLVSRRTLVTPAARDSLRAAGIELVYDRQTPSSGAELSGPSGNRPVPTASLTESPILLWIDTAATDRSSALFAQARRHCPPARIQAVDYRPLVTTSDPPGDLARPLVSALASGERVVWLTELPSAALCAANRHPSVRAAWALDEPSLSEACSTLRPNLIVVQPTRLAISHWAAIVRKLADVTRS